MTPAVWNRQQQPRRASQKLTPAPRPRLERVMGSSYGCRLLLSQTALKKAEKPEQVVLQCEGCIRNYTSAGPKNIFPNVSLSSTGVFEDRSNPVK